jgi:hypothetical protein
MLSKQDYPYKDTIIGTHWVMYQSLGVDPLGRGGNSHRIEIILSMSATKGMVECRYDLTGEIILLIRSHCHKTVEEVEKWARNSEQPLIHLAEKEIGLEAEHFLDAPKSISEDQTVYYRWFLSCNDTKFPEEPEQSDRDRSLSMDAEPSSVYTQASGP